MGREEIKEWEGKERLGIKTESLGIKTASEIAIPQQNTNVLIWKQWIYNTKNYLNHGCWEQYCDYYIQSLKIGIAVAEVEWSHS